eukprot:6200047-Pleurochrysis_carterae.AAC.3
MAPRYEAELYAHRYSYMLPSVFECCVAECKSAVRLKQALTSSGVVDACALCAAACTASAVKKCAHRLRTKKCASAVNGTCGPM